MNLTLISHWFDTGDRVLNAISKCKRHSSVVIINEKNKQTNKHKDRFSFSEVQFDDILKKPKLSMYQKHINKQIYPLKS